VLAGTNSTSFTAPVSTCGTSLAAGASCTISTSFAPAATGAASAYIFIIDNANGVFGATQDILLSGTGI
jgi:hypothetical protein